MGRADFASWRPALTELCDHIRRDTREALGAALQAGDLASIARPTGQGAGDLTFGLDLPSERRIDAWFRERALEGPLSVLTEDTGWRHLGPDGSGGVRPLDDFDHGGPRIAFDPVDGTRNLMADLRSAWTVVSFASAGPSMPRLGDLTGGILGELPPSRQASYRTLEAEAGGPCLLTERPLDGRGEPSTTTLRVDDDDRVDHGYFPFFGYMPALWPEIARLSSAFFQRIERAEGADLRSIFDDLYISNAGQLVLLALGTYRMIVDPRALVGMRLGVSTVTSKPYDVAGAILVARAAGCRVQAADGAELDFPIDTSTPVHFAGYTNAATAARLQPHWLATLET